jgi:hypothetical protein
MAGADYELWAMPAELRNPWRDRLYGTLALPLRGPSVLQMPRGTLAYSAMVRAAARGTRPAPERRGEGREHLPAVVIGRGLTYGDADRRAGAWRSLPFFAANRP